MKKLLVLLIGVQSIIPQFALAGAASTPSNKEIATEFFVMAFTDRKPKEAALKYISEEQYIQHNPESADGRDAFINGYAEYVLSTKYVAEVKRVAAEGDLVFIHSHGKYNPEDPNDRGEAVVDIFRVEDGKIVEHWDVLQAVPEKAENNNTMF